MEFGKKLLSIQQVRNPLVQQLALGEALLEQNKPHLAELCFDQVLKEGGEVKLVALARIGKGKALRARGLFETAHRQLSLAVEAAAAAGEAPILLLALTEEADTWSAQGRPEQALRALADGYRRITSLGEAPVPKAHVRIKEGFLLQQLGRLDEALSRFHEAERILSNTTEEEKPAQEALLLCLLGQADVLVSLRQAKEALDIICGVREKLSESDGRRFHQASLEIEAKCHALLGEQRQAVRCLENLAAISKKGSVYAQLALTYFTLGEPDRAREWEEKALAALKEREDIETRTALFRLNMQRGQVKEASRHLDVVVEQLFSLKHEMVQLKRSQLQVDLWVDEAKVNAAEDTARKIHNQLLHLKEEGRNVDLALLSVYQSLGLIGNLKGQRDEAESMFRKALQLAHQVGIPLAIGHAMANLGRCLMGKGDLKAAEDLLVRAEGIIGGSGEVLSLRYLLLDKVRLSVLEDPAQLPEATERLVTLLEENARFQCPRLNIAGLMTLGWFHWRGGRYEEARETFLKVKQIAEETGMELRRLFAMGMIGLLEYEAGNKELAEQWLGEALEGMELRGTEVSLADALTERFRDLTSFP